MRQDLRYALRQLRLNPMFSTLVVSTFALGIGLNTALFTLVNTLLLRALPGFETNRIVIIWEKNPEGDFHTVSGRTVREWRSQARSFEQIEAGAIHLMTLTGDGPSEVLKVSLMTAGYFRLYRTQAALGRAFMPEEDRPGRSRIAILDHTFWQRRFGGDPSIVGRSITLNQQPYLVAGVMPAGFHPLGAGLVSLYAPLVMDELPAWDFWTVARLRPGVTLEQARAEMAVISQRLKSAHPGEKKDVEANVVSVHEMWTKDIRTGLLLLFGAVGLVLLIACANIANLLLARGTARGREFALRLALGASRFRLMRQVLTEGLLLSSLGGALGLLLANWVVALVVRMKPDGLPRLEEVTLDPAVFGFAAMVTVLTGLLSSFGPALFVKGDGLKREGRSIAGGASQNLVRRLLIVSEVALTFVLVSGAALLVQSFAHLQRVPLGYDPERLLTLTLTLPETNSPDGRALAALYGRLLTRLEKLPGVESVAAATRMPLGGVGITFGVRVEGRPDPPAHVPEAQTSIVSPGYYEALRIAVRQGRGFTERDRFGATETVIINETLAKRFFPNENPLGRRLLIPTLLPNVAGVGEKTLREIVGVVNDVRQEAIKEPAPLQLYLPLDQNGIRFTALAIRTRGDPLAMASVVQREIAGEDKNLPATDVQSMDDRRAVLLVGPRNATALFGIFAALAVLLAALGIYGVLSYTTARRTREIGIRLALGAHPGQMRMIVLRECFLLTGAGIALGTASALAGGRLIESQLYGVKAADPMALYGATLGVLVVALAAASLPARRATRVDPATALREE